MTQSDSESRAVSMVFSAAQRGEVRGAEFPPGVAEIHVDAIMGNIEIELD